MLTRREMLATGTAFTGYALSVDVVLAQAIKTDTDGITVTDAKVAVGGFDVPVYEARPASGSNHPIVLVISEIWGVHEYIRDSTRRFAKAGYYAIAPELFAREGDVKSIPNVQDVLKIVLAVKREQALGDIKAAVDWAKKRPGVAASKVGVTGWCWGGSKVYQVAGTNPDIKAAVAWYGPPARPYKGASGDVTGFDLAKDIKAPFLGLYGAKDQNPKPEDAQKFGEMLKQHGNKNVEVVVYPESGHGFHADYRPSYNKADAEDAWKRCTGWFKKHLG
ncbi:MAG TPA: dienelactone hydrolase family protein [Methylomirabilota bacterium]|jgi:carboxymethylenebutenolidase|nr:dienelactone hydrolase family protein [Methylomirabilota bacterium]